MLLNISRCNNLYLHMTERIFCNLIFDRPLSSVCRLGLKLPALHLKYKMSCAQFFNRVHIGNDRSCFFFKPTVFFFLHQTHADRTILCRNGQGFSFTVILESDTLTICDCSVRIILKESLTFCSPFSHVYSLLHIEGFVFVHIQPLIQGFGCHDVPATKLYRRKALALDQCIGLISADMKPCRQFPSRQYRIFILNLSYPCVLHPLHLFSFCDRLNRLHATFFCRGILSSRSSRFFPEPSEGLLIYSLVHYYELLCAYYKVQFYELSIGFSKKVHFFERELFRSGKNVVLYL